MRYSVYEEYQSECLEVPVKIPTTWNTKRLKYIFKEIDERGEGRVTNRLSLTSDRGLINNSELQQRSSEASDYGKYKVCIPGDLVMNKMQAWNGIFGLCSVQGIVSPDYTVFRAIENISLKFFEYLLRSPLYAGIFFKKCRGMGTAFLRLNTDAFGDTFVPFPSLEEQKQIAEFLNRETAKIDQLITKQEELIRLLGEKRTAVISHAVTKGVNPYAPMKDSGIEWLGQIPTHWERSRLGFECSVKARLGWKGLKAEEYVHNGYIFLATPNIKGKYIDFENVNYITKERYEESPEIMLEVGDVLVTKDGSTTGTTNVVRDLPSPATVNSSIAVIRSKGKLDSLYLYYFFLSAYTQNVINQMQGGMGVPHLFQADLRWFHVLIPSFQEQKVIAAFIEKQEDKLTALLKKAELSIELLKERRTALISAAVTGKIDVRHYS